MVITISSISDKSKKKKKSKLWLTCLLRFNKSGFRDWSKSIDRICASAPWTVHQSELILNENIRGGIRTKLNKLNLHQSTNIKILKIDQIDRSSRIPRIQFLQAKSVLETFWKPFYLISVPDDGKVFWWNALISSKSSMEIESRYTFSRKERMLITEFISTWRTHLRSREFEKQNGHHLDLAISSSYVKQRMAIVRRPLVEQGGLSLQHSFHGLRVAVLNSTEETMLGVRRAAQPLPHGRELLRKNGGTPHAAAARAGEALHLYLHPAAVRRVRWRWRCCWWRSWWAPPPRPAIELNDFPWIKSFPLYTPPIVDSFKGVRKRTTFGLLLNFHTQNTFDRKKLINYN